MTSDDRGYPRITFRKGLLTAGLDLLRALEAQTQDMRSTGKSTTFG